MQIIRKNFTLKVLALAIALVGWAYLRFTDNPVVAARFNQELSVPITTVNVPVGYSARYSESVATITIASKRGAPEVRQQDVKAVLDLAGRGAGVYNIPIEIVAPDVVIQSLSPASVTLSLEKMAQRKMSVVLHYSGNRPKGIVVDQSSLNPSSVTVNAASGALSQIVEIRAEVAIPSEARTFDEMLRPVPVDAQGHEVPDVVIAPDLVRVHVDFVAAAASQ